MGLPGGAVFFMRTTSLPLAAPADAGPGQGATFDDMPCREPSVAPCRLKQLLGRRMLRAPRGDPGLQ